MIIQNKCHIHITLYISIYIYIYIYLLILLLYTRLNVFFSLWEDVVKNRNTWGHLLDIWTIGNGDPMHGVCIPHRIPRV